MNASLPSTSTAATGSLDDRLAACRKTSRSRELFGAPDCNPFAGNVFIDDATKISFPDLADLLQLAEARKVGGPDVIGLVSLSRGAMKDIEARFGQEMAERFRRAPSLDISSFERVERS